MRKIVTNSMILLVLFFAFAFPSVVGATPAAQTVKICWTEWVFLKQCVNIDTSAYANPAITARWNGAQPFMGMRFGGSWDISYEGGSFNITPDYFRVTSTNPNLPYSIEVDDFETEIGVIGDGQTFGPSMVLQSGVTITIGE